MHLCVSLVLLCPAHFLLILCEQTNKQTQPRLSRANTLSSRVWLDKMSPSAIEDVGSGVGVTAEKMTVAGGSNDGRGVGSLPAIHLETGHAQVRCASRRGVQKPGCHYSHNSFSTERRRLTLEEESDEHRI
jgi:hypothetical protein